MNSPLTTYPDPSAEFESVGGRWVIGSLGGMRRHQEGGLYTTENYYESYASGRGRTSIIYLKDANGKEADCWFYLRDGKPFQGWGKSHFRARLIDRPKLDLSEIGLDN